MIENLSRLILHGLCFDGGGGGGGTQSTTANMMPWGKYVPPITEKTYEETLPKLAGRFGEGLSPEERQRYAGDIISSTGAQFKGAEQALTEGLARSGVEGGAKAEALSDLGRSKVMATSAGLSGLAGKDIDERRLNREELLRWIKAPSSPIQVGQNTTTSPSGGGGS